MLAGDAFRRSGLELAELRHADNNREAVDEAKHDRVRDKADKPFLRAGIEMESAKALSVERIMKLYSLGGFARHRPVIA